MSTFVSGSVGRDDGGPGSNAVTSLKTGRGGGTDEAGQDDHSLDAKSLEAFAISSRHESLSKTNLL